MFFRSLAPKVCKNLCLTGKVCVIHQTPWVPSSHSFAFPARSLGLTILGEILAYVTVFSPTIEVVTFRLEVNFMKKCIIIMTKNTYTWPASQDIVTSLFFLILKSQLLMAECGLCHVTAKCVRDTQHSSP